MNNCLESNCLQSPEEIMTGTQGGSCPLCVWVCVWVCVSRLEVISPGSAYVLTLTCTVRLFPGSIFLTRMAEISSSRTGVGHLGLCVSIPGGAWDASWLCPDSCRQRRCEQCLYCMIVMHVWCQLRDWWCFSAMWLSSRKNVSLRLANVPLFMECSFLNYIKRCLWPGQWRLHRGAFVGSLSGGDVQA